MVADIKPRGAWGRHKDFIPWRLVEADAHSPVADALRGMSCLAKGEDVRVDRRNAANVLHNYLTTNDLVVDYDRVEGFIYVPRNPEIDDPALPIRRPA